MKNVDQAKKIFKSLNELGDFKLLVRNNKDQFAVFPHLLSHQQELFFSKNIEFFNTVINNRLGFYPSGVLYLLKLKTLDEETIISQVLDLDNLGKVG